MEKQPTEFDPVPMDSEDDLFIAYTSGTSSKPRLIVHTQAGYLLYAAFTHKVLCTWLHCSTDIVCMSEFKMTLAVLTWSLSSQILK